MDRIGVLLGGRIAPMESIARSIDAQDDMTLIGVVHSWDAIVERVKEGAVDVVLWENDKTRTRLNVEELLGFAPRLRVFSIVPAGPGVEVHELRPHVTALGNVKISALLQAIRGRSGDWRTKIQSG